MKLKKILAGAMVAAMILTAIPTNGMQAFANYPNDILTSSYEGYKNIDLYPATTSEHENNVTVTGGIDEPNYPATNVLQNNYSKDWCTKWSYNCFTNGENYILFTLTEPQTVAGVLYYSNTFANGFIRRAKVEVSTDGETYTEVYQTSSTDKWSTDDESKQAGNTDKKREALFTPVENVKMVRVWGIETNGQAADGSRQ